ncbi:MAG: Fic family protein, partial [Candidatus Eremiobacteraeota bacterium]|nr:Fic family protein [Candidatus Eremiobacteraeota bacterium]
MSHEDLLHFRPDLTHMPYRFWALLGEAKSKCEHISRAPLLPKFREEMHRISLVKGVLATTAIEGNTLNQGEVEAILAGKLRMPPSKAYLEQEIRNVVDAITALVSEEGRALLTIEALCEYNSRILANLELEDGLVAGALRKRNVGVGSYRCPPWENVPAHAAAFVKWFNAFEHTLTENFELQTAIIKAILSHVYFVLIHPFADGNGRTARLLEWHVLDTAGVSTAAVHLLSNFYNETRSRYYAELDKVSKTGKIDSFLLYAVQGFVDQLAEQLGLIEKQQQELVFLRRLEDAYSANNTATAARRRLLAFALAQHGPADFRALRTLTGEVAAAYATKTSKTLTRDLNALRVDRLIEWSDDVKGYVALLDPSV